MQKTDRDSEPLGPDDHRNAALAAEEEWVAQSQKWTDAHAKLNLLRNGGWDDPVKDHDGYLQFSEAPPPVELWQEDPGVYEQG